MITIQKIQGVRIDGVVGCVPSNRISNRDSCKDLYGDGVETLLKATGIQSRCIVDKGTTSLDLCVSAAKELLSKTNTSVDAIGAVICVTFTPEHIMPADAPAAQTRLGLDQGVMAFDINMACSGYGYGLYTASLIAKTMRKKVLLLDGDVQSAYLSFQDKSTLPVMADAGTATLVSPESNGKEWDFSFITDGSRRDVLMIPDGGSKSSVREESLAMKEYEDGSKRRGLDIFMDGFSVFKFVAIDVSRFLTSFLQQTVEDVSCLDVFVPHQANMYMIGQLVKKLKIDIPKMWKSGDVFGNPGSSSVPLSIAYNAKEWIENGENTDKVLISGFGGGLSASVGLLDLPKNAYYDVITYGLKSGEKK